MINIYLNGLYVVLTMMTIIWIISVIIRNASIVDIFWGTSFVLANLVYLLSSDSISIRQIILLILVAIWGFRLSIYIVIRNKGKGEDFRYRQFRKNWGEHRYWWISLFQVFLLQGVLSWLVSAPLAAINYFSGESSLNILDFLGLFIWLVGFIFESGGDYQLARFKANPANKGKILDTGFWRLTRHPNYFGDSAVWWGFGLICIASGSYIPVLGSLLMTFLIIRISGVYILEKSLKNDKPGYAEYVYRTSAFIPWLPRKKIVKY
ncbi:MAG TPA: DUF1295 domain-containing protein [Bacteroidales bacterium]|nr:DUF1295 domain-containing protein [Bacteroidales bacterium]